MHLSECVCCLPGLVRGQCTSRSRGLPPSLLLHMLRLTSQHCRVLLRYGLLPGFGSLPSDLLKAVWLCWLGILPHFILPWWTRMFTSRGTSHCHYPFCSFPTACETFLTAKCTFTVVTGSPALPFQYTGGVCCLTFLPAAPPPVHLWVSCKVISWCHHSRMFHLLPSTLGGGEQWLLNNV